MIQVTIVEFQGEEVDYLATWMTDSVPGIGAWLELPDGTGFHVTDTLWHPIIDPVDESGISALVTLIGESTPSPPFPQLKASPQPPAPPPPPETATELPEEPPEGPPE